MVDNITALVLFRSNITIQKLPSSIDSPSISFRSNLAVILSIHPFIQNLLDWRRFSIIFVIFSKGQQPMQIPPHVAHPPPLHLPRVNKNRYVLRCCCLCLQNLSGAGGYTQGYTRQGAGGRQGGVAGWGWGNFGGSDFDRNIGCRTQIHRKPQIITIEP